MSSNDSILNRELAAMESREDWQRRVLLTGGLIGAAVGLLTSWLLVRTSRETRGGPPAISTGDAIKVGVTTIGLVRAIASLGDKR
ncbi:MAG TPA: hypothetical protein VF434_01615 [Promineifilum sp.]